MIARLLTCLGLFLCLLAPPAGAHKVRPAYLQIDERAPHHYDLLWKVPTRDGMMQDIRPEFGPGFTLTLLPGETVVEGFVLFRYRLTGERDLAGTTLRIENLDRSTIDTLVNVSLLDGAHHSLLLRPRQPAAAIPEAPSAWQVVTSYTRLGVEHILAASTILPSSQR